MNTLGSHGLNQPSDFYDAAPLEPHLLYQGEVVVDVPILVAPKPTRWQLLRTRNNEPLDEVLERVGNIGNQVRVLDSNQSEEKWYGPTTGDYAVARIDKKPALVLSQTCDIQTKDYIQIAPIFPLPSEDAERVKRGDLYTAFYLQDHPPDVLHEGFADLEKMQSVHKSYLKRPFPKIHFRLTDENVRRLKYFITRYFGRPNCFDVDNDSCPRTGTYICVACVYMAGKITAVDRVEGQNFENCRDCQGTQWFLRGR